MPALVWQEPLLPVDKRPLSAGAAAQTLQSTAKKSKVCCQCKWECSCASALSTLETPCKLSQHYVIVDMHHKLYGHCTLHCICICTV